MYLFPMRRQSCGVIQGKLRMVWCPGGVGKGAFQQRVSREFRKYLQVADELEESQILVVVILAIQGSG